MTLKEKLAIVAEFNQAWPNAQYGPAHIILADHNLDSTQVAWCDGIIWAVQEERRRSGHTLYVDHSDHELEATRRMLVLLQTGQPETQIRADLTNVDVRRWEDVPNDTASEWQ